MNNRLKFAIGLGVAAFTAAEILVAGADQGLASRVLGAWSR